MWVALAERHCRENGASDRSRGARENCRESRLPENRQKKPRTTRTFKQKRAVHAPFQKGAADEGAALQFLLLRHVYPLNVCTEKRGDCSTRCELTFSPGGSLRRFNGSPRKISSV